MVLPFALSPQIHSFSWQCVAYKRTAQDGNGLAFAIVLILKGTLAAWYKCKPMVHKFGHIVQFLRKA